MFRKETEIAHRRHLKHVERSPGGNPFHKAFSWRPPDEDFSVPRLLAVDCQRLVPLNPSSDFSEPVEGRVIPESTPDLRQFRYPQAGLYLLTVEYGCGITRDRMV